MVKKIVTSGADNEYVLSGLSQYLRSFGHDVAEPDFGTLTGDPNTCLENYAPGEAVYITSAHINLNHKVASAVAPSFNKFYPHYLAPLEIMAILKPDVSIYIPHDLLMPFGDTNLNEYRYLDLFDHVVVPFGAEILRATLPVSTIVHEGGWIKYLSGDREEVATNTLWNNSTPRVLLCVSMFEHLRNKYGVKGMADYFRPLVSNEDIGDKILIKLPVRREVAEFAESLAKISSGRVSPNSINSITLIKNADVVICNGASSIHAEACLLGVPTICLLDDEGISAQEQKKKLSKLPGIYFHDYRRKIPISLELIMELALKKSDPVLKPFRYSVIADILQ